MLSEQAAMRDPINACARKDIRWSPVRSFAARFRELRIEDGNAIDKGQKKLSRSYGRFRSMSDRKPHG